MSPGGHTSEALALLSSVDFARYRPRMYFVSHGDILSAKKAIELEADKNSGSPPHIVSTQYSLLNCRSDHALPDLLNSFIILYMCVLSFCLDRGRARKMVVRIDFFGGRSRSDSSGSWVEFA